MKLFRALYSRWGERRVGKITKILLPYIPTNASILDVGCGDGSLAQSLKKKLPNIQITGIDTLKRENEKIKVILYDGKNIPFESESFDYLMLITVLHHCDDYLPVLKEAKRVAKKGIIIFDHQYKNRFEYLMLCLIDIPGNIPFGVYTPFNFKTRKQWLDMFNNLNLLETKHSDKVYLFGKFFNFLFGRKMHFVSVLNKQ